MGHCKSSMYLCCCWYFLMTALLLQGNCECRISIVTDAVVFLHHYYSTFFTTGYKARTVFCCQVLKSLSGSTVKSLIKSLVTANESLIWSEMKAQ